MELLLNGAWIGKQGLYNAAVSRVRYAESLDNLDTEGRTCFVLLSYDLGRQTTGIPLKQSSLPPALILELSDLAAVAPGTGHCRLDPGGCSLSDGEYLAGVGRIKEYIAEGAIYQVNLTNRFDFTLTGDPRDLFFRFISSQPVPYSFFLRHPDFYVISGSMELFLEREGPFLRSKPIKGTGTTRAFLEGSDKDKAENLMITDMVRNDIGVVAATGSVRVTELFKITKYRTLYQMHSTVEGRTSRDFESIQKAAFPPASVTGAPKIKAVEIIDRLEPHPRSYYCGSAGVILPSGDFIQSVLIRTAIGQGPALSYYAGCGIVWDSIPGEELKELYLKVKAFSLAGSVGMADTHAASQRNPVCDKV